MKQATFTDLRSFGRRFTDNLDLREGGRWIMLASLLGLAIGLAAGIFQAGLDFSHDVLFAQPEAALNSTVHTTEARRLSRILFLLLVPAAGAAASAWLTFTFAPEATGHGTDAVVRAYHRAAGRVRFRVAPLKLLASMMTLGTGGSAGREGPVAQFGGTLGSVMGNLLHLGPRARRILLLSGAAGGIGAIFRAPLGGALFAAEVVYRGPDFEGSAVFPGVIAAIVAYSTFIMLGHREPLFAIPALGFEHPSELPFFAALGLLCAAVGIIYVRVFYRGERVFKRIPLPAPARAAIGGASLGALTLLFGLWTGDDHLLLGGGYGLAQNSIDGRFPPLLLLSLAMAKIFATTFTISSGGSGGVFAPSLAIGACLGGAFGAVGQTLLPGIAPSPAACALVGMGGFFAGVAKTPLTSVILICEMTGSYGLILPLILVSTVTSLLAPRTSIYREQVQSRSESPAHQGELAAAALASMHVSDALQAGAPTRSVSRATPIKEVAERAIEEGVSSFAVVDEDGRLLGLLTLSDLHVAGREAIGSYLIAQDLVRVEVPRVTPNIDLREALTLLVANDEDDLVVVDPHDPDRLIAILSRHDLLRTYQKLTSGARPDAPGSG